LPLSRKRGVVAARTGTREPAVALRGAAPKMKRLAATAASLFCYTMKQAAGTRVMHRLVVKQTRIAIVR